jgi:NDP-sugar pyrophosphorylase family protein
MKGMILAAGLGTRLRPLTDHRPKALVEVNGRTLLEITLARMRSLGITDVIINAHHFAEMITDYLKGNSNFGMNLAISLEDNLLDTGGGLKKAAYFFHEDVSDSAEPILLHNVDVISNIDIQGMLRFHVEQGALATLAVQDRKTSRYLLFDGDGCLRGRKSDNNVERNSDQITPSTRLRGFCGIHILSPSLLTRMSEVGAFSIITSYVRLAAEGEKILAFCADPYYWRDLGNPENVARATEDIKRNLITL